MGRALWNAIPAFAALAAGYQGVQAVFSCVVKAGVDRGCLLGGYFWLTAAALFVVLWIVVQATFGRRRAGRSGPGGPRPDGEGRGV